MARFSSVGEFSPALTVIGVGSTNSNPLTTAAAKDARAFVHVTALDPVASLDVEVQISHDLTRWAPVASFNQITTTGSYVVPLRDDQLGKYTRLKYTASVGTATLGAALEKKSGV